MAQRRPGQRSECAGPRGVPPDVFTDKDLANTYLIKIALKTDLQQLYRMVLLRSLFGDWSLVRGNIYIIRITGARWGH